MLVSYHDADPAFSSVEAFLPGSMGTASLVVYMWHPRGHCRQSCCFNPALSFVRTRDGKFSTTAVMYPLPR
jgi:hypothetical protein